VYEKPHQATTSFQRVSLVFRPCPWYVRNQWQTHDGNWGPAL